MWIWGDCLESPGLRIVAMGRLAVACEVEAPPCMPLAGRAGGKGLA